MKEFFSSLIDRKKTIHTSEKVLTVEDIRSNVLVDAYLNGADSHMEGCSCIEHGRRHANLVSNISYNIVKRVGRSDREAELAAIAGYLHDIGYVINRAQHAQMGALLSHTILLHMGMKPREIIEVVAAIGNHDEANFDTVNPIAAALMLADKSDVHRSRVRSSTVETLQPEERIYFAVENSFLRVDGDGKEITLELSIDTQISKIMDYFGIFLGHMRACEKAASYLSCKFRLEINGTKVM
ncbi:MAG: HD domain-containing protein [Calditrichaeota bacterium]|nr:HD domain-containing protein [Calditrichota bacterium]